MELWIVIVEDRGEVFVHPFNCLEMARKYARETELINDLQPRLNTFGVR